MGFSRFFTFGRRRFPGRLDAMILCIRIMRGRVGVRIPTPVGKASDSLLFSLL